MIHPVAVMGAGPFGLSTAAHLRARGIPVRVFGRPMVSWRDHMPEGMLLKSTPAASSIDAPQPGHTLRDYCDAAGIPRLVTDDDIIPVETFMQLEAGDILFIDSTHVAKAGSDVLWLFLQVLPRLAELG